MGGQWFRAVILQAGKFKQKHIVTMKALKDKLLDARNQVTFLRNQRAKARSEFFETSKKLEMANEFKDNVVQARNPIQGLLDKMVQADHKLKSSEKEFEEAVDKMERIEKEIEEEKKRVVSKPDDTDFWKTSIF